MNRRTFLIYSGALLSVNSRSAPKVTRYVTYCGRVEDGEEILCRDKFVREDQYYIYVVSADGKPNAVARWQLRP